MLGSRHQIQKAKSISLGSIVNVQSVIDYILLRRHDNGGYCFVQYLNETNIYDTYYAIKTLMALGVELPYKEKKTVDFIARTLESSPTLTAKSISMGIEALIILEEKELALKYIDDLFKYYNKDEGCFTRGLYGSEEFGYTTALESTCYALKALNLVKFNLSSQAKDRIRKYIMKFKLPRGGYGEHNESSMTLTFHAIQSLIYLGFIDEVLNDTETKAQIELCELHTGGFTEKPNTKPPYLESTYYGIRMLKVFNTRPRYINQHISYITSLQNANGGFRRSPMLGISDFANTYRAVSALVELLK